VGQGKANNEMALYGAKIGVSVVFTLCSVSLLAIYIVCSRSVLPSRLSSRVQVVWVWVLQLEGEGYRLRRVALGVVQLAVEGYRIGCLGVYKNNLTASYPTETVCNTPLHC